MPSPVFESLRVWHDARRIASWIYRATQAPAFAGDFALRDQMRRAAISVMSNIAEGYECGSRRSFAHFLNIAKGSAAEVRSQLYAAEDIGYLNAKVASELRAEVLTLARRIAQLRDAR
jgi:four helix bundle protein